MTQQSVEEVNRLALAAAAGIEDEQAADRLRARVAFSVDSSSAAAKLAEYTRRMLARTLHVVDDLPADIEIAVGNRLGTGGSSIVQVCLKNDAVTFTSELDGSSESDAQAETPLLLLKIAACYLAGYVIAKTAAPDRFESMPMPFTVSSDTLGFAQGDFSRNIEFDDNSVLVGAGGVANGFLWALEDLNVSGRLHVTDPKRVSDSNLNRCLYFSPEDVGRPKVEVLAQKALKGKVELVPHFGEFKTLSRKLGRVRRAYTTVDSRRIRRSVRGELPLEILDASTTDISEVVVFSERQPTAMACLSCIYAHIPQEAQREQHIADALGVALSDVQESIISREVARKLVQANPASGLNAEQLCGTAFDSLFRQMCGTGTLLKGPAKQALAPLGFISNLAGCLLALELLRFESSTPPDGAPNYMALDPWRPPYRRARLSKPARSDCEFCSKPENQDVLQELWSDVLA